MGFPINHGFKTYLPLNNDRLNTLRVQYRNISVVFIDELSMVGSGMLNYVNLRLQQIKGNHRLFGGVSVILIGDLCQLKPVLDSWIFEDLVGDYGPLATNIWRELFKVHTLTEIMRQKDDKHFAELLNRLRKGNQTCADIHELKKRICNPADPDYPHGAPHLFATRNLVKTHNENLFDGSNAEKIKIPALDAVAASVPRRVKQKILRLDVLKDTRKTMGLEYSLEIAIGLRYDIVANLDIEDGLVNGASCVAKKVECRLTTTNRPSIIWVLFEQEKIGRNQRRKYKCYYEVGIDRTWTPIFDIRRSFNVKPETSVIAVNRIQFPLRSSGAKTVHSAQGDTLNQAVVHLGFRAIAAIHYVALSRVRTMSGLHILHLNEKKINASQKVARELERLATEAPLQLCYTPLYSVELNKMKVVFHNARSLHAHFADVFADHSFQSADIIGLAESR